MLRRALDFRQAIDDFVVKTHDLRPYELSDADWAGIELVMTWLKAFRSATTQMSTTKCSMLSTAHAIFRGLQESLQDDLAELPDSAPVKLRSALTSAHRKLSDYYFKIDESPFYIWASSMLPFIASLFG
ncbi:uncharacterized protein EDB93DRAFT_1090343 [Suillus bovinus]|uniref:uncharacterized protein n=1 Tax=Suillus bovinus TaxID=48563 RepID=UPI001B885654|nr:uncharacterized protein EDB93DRAFT_1090343 [Suillus bovinus]KAG2139132.1 hypothetical protein EDB93DRAFT_1090343 [Suillus bovinus]